MNKYNFDDITFSLFFQQTINEAYKVAYQIMQNKQDAQDVVQDAYSKLYKVRQKITSPDMAIKWLVVITKNEAFNMLKKRNRSITVQSDYLEWLVNNQYSEKTTEEQLIIKEEMEAIDQILENLNSHWSNALRLKYLAGFSAKEISQIYDVSIHTVYSWLQRGIKAIRKEKDRDEKKKK